MQCVRCIRRVQCRSCSWYIVHNVYVLYIEHMVCIVDSVYVVGSIHIAYNAYDAVATDIDDVTSLVINDPVLSAVK